MYIGFIMFIFKFLFLCIQKSLANFFAAHKFCHVIYGGFDPQFKKLGFRAGKMAKAVKSTDCSCTSPYNWLTPVHITSSSMGS